MKLLRSGVVVAGLFGAALAGPADARDLYKGFLDPALPHHRAILDTIARLDEDPKNPGLHNDLGCLVAWDGFWRDALREFATAATLDRKDGRPLFNAGLVHIWKGEWGAAGRSFGKATSRAPGNWPAWWMLGYAREQMGHVDSAVDAYKTSLRVDTSLFEVRKNPFAANTKLKARVLLETYQKRLVRAAMPETEQWTDADRVASFFQRGPRPALASAPGRGRGDEDAPPLPPLPQSGGPVVTSVPPVSTSRPTVSGPPGPVNVRPAPRRPVEEEMVPLPAGTTSAPAPRPPGPGGFDDVPSPAPTPLPPSTTQL